jgi:hypothetical protein
MNPDKGLDLMRFITAVCVTVLMMAGTATLSAEPVRTPIASYRLDRLYFDLGEESQIYRHAPFTVLNGSDTAYSGLIAHAWDGVAVSEPTGGIFDTLDWRDWEAVIETAECDSGSTIVVGTDIEDLTLLADSMNSGRVELEVIRHHEDLVDDFHLGVLDAIISFRDISPKPEDIVTIAHPLPYVVALVPNIGRECNYQGQLTTSLYYRFDTDHLEISFDGDRVQMARNFQSRAASDDEGPLRLYPYDPERGRGLFEAMLNRPERLSIYSGSSSLDGVAHYFADLISRDRCKVDLIDNQYNADLRVEYLPLSQSLPSVTVYALYYHLITDSLANTLASEQVRRIAAELQYVESPELPAVYYRHLNNAGRIMMEDLGVFPLFRPTIFFHHHKYVQNVAFSRDGQIDLSGAILVHMPPPPVESEP